MSIRIEYNRKPSPEDVREVKLPCAITGSSGDHLTLTEFNEDGFKVIAREGSEFAIIKVEAKDGAKLGKLLTDLYGHLRD